MAGDWIPVTVGLSRRREVLAIVGSTERDRFQVVGLLVEFWSWVTDESRDGHVPSVTASTLIAAVGGDDVFWSAVEREGWIVLDDEGLTVPNWDRWLGSSGKSRLQAAIRKRREREKKDSPPQNVTH